jgi:antitoxin CptB
MSRDPRDTNPSGGPGSEALEVTLRRARLRSWRRGTREMDLVLGRFADATLDRLDARALSDYEALLAEADHDIFRWIGGQGSIPVQHRPIVRRIRAYHQLG